MIPALTRIAVLATRPIWPLFAPGQDQAAKALGIEYGFIDMPQPEAVGAAMRQARAERGTGRCDAWQPVPFVCTAASDYR